MKRASCFQLKKWRTFVKAKEHCSIPTRCKQRGKTRLMSWSSALIFSQYQATNFTLRRALALYTREVGSITNPLFVEAGKRKGGVEGLKTFPISWVLDALQSSRCVRLNMTTQGFAYFEIGWRSEF